MSIDLNTLFQSIAGVVASTNQDVNNEQGLNFLKGLGEGVEMMSSTITSSIDEITKKQESIDNLVIFASKLITEESSVLFGMTLKPLYRTVEDFPIHLKSSPFYEIIVEGYSS